MPTKARRRKDSARTASQKELDLEWDEFLQNVSHDLTMLPIGNNLACGDIYSTNFISIDDDGEPYAHERMGVGGNEQREDDSYDRALRLKNKYPHLWGKRSGPKQIVHLEQMQQYKERAEGKSILSEKLSTRTIQKYFKKYP